MLLEARRFGRRFMGISRGKGGHIAYLFLSAVIYGLLLLLTIAFHDGFEANYVIVAQTVLMCIVIPSVAQNAVAGEREKRTWELLIASPVSRAQILIGKYLSILIVLGYVTVAFLPLVLLSFNRQSETIGSVFLAEFVSLAFAAALSAAATLISAATTRSLACQSLTYALIFVWLVMVPLVISVAADAQMRDLSHQYLWVQPIYVITSLNHNDYSRNALFSEANPYYSFGAQAVFYAFLTSMFLLWGVRSVNRRGAEFGG
jgi:ABC-type transport system involved in multi-copper enzyme maturation permease subunit